MISKSDNDELARKEVLGDSDHKIKQLKQLMISQSDNDWHARNEVLGDSNHKIKQQTQLINSESDYDWLVKVVVLGDVEVGKTNILSRFCDEKFTIDYALTIGVEFKIKTIDVDGKRIKLQIWDITGQERFRNITKTYYKGSYGIIITYSVNNRQSFENVENWIKLIKENTPGDIFQILVGNKCDISAAERSVDTGEGNLLAKKYNIPFIEVSAKENLHITDLFKTLGSVIKIKLEKE